MVWYLRGGQPGKTANKNAHAIALTTSAQDWTHPMTSVTITMMPSSHEMATPSLYALPNRNWANQ